MPTQRQSNAQSRKESPDGRELLVLELQEIYSAETQLSRILPRLAKSAVSDALRSRLEERLTQGERVLREVDEALVALDESPGRKKNVAAEGLINDAREHVQEIKAGPALDAVLIGAIQKTEHYCIASWGTVKALAEALGEKNAARSMERALKEGKAFDEQLTTLAVKEVTPSLLAQDSESESESESEGEDAEDTGGRGQSRSPRKNGERRAN
jgi:ferritin-like metal-binding protein YciE